MIRNMDLDIIFLQESNMDYINGINVNDDYYVWTKLFNPKRNEYYLSLLSKYPIIRTKILDNGYYFDDGIVLIELNTKQIFGDNLIVINAHFIGGEFGKNKETILHNQNVRIKQLNTISNEINSNNYNFVILCGDFNYDGNDTNCAEYSHSIELNTNLIDIWTFINKNNNSGYTEDELLNKFRSKLKIKKFNELKRARYDRIFISKTITPQSIQLIGTKPINKYGKQLIIGKDKHKNIHKNMEYLWPSDHFGLFSRIKVGCFEKRVNKQS